MTAFDSQDQAHEREEDTGGGTQHGDQLSGSHIALIGTLRVHLTYVRTHLNLAFEELEELERVLGMRNG